MKVLFLVQKEQRVILDRLYQGVVDHSECDLRLLSSKEQSNLRKYFKENVQLNEYDRVLLFLRFKKELKQVRFISSIPNLVVLEHDAYQNYIDCKYTGKFSSYYKRMPWVRVISSGATVVDKLKGENVDAVFVAKGYDQNMLHDQGGGRDIEFGFIGSVKSVAYSSRKELLDEMVYREGMVALRTESGEEYLNALNRIQFFLSADIGMGEYMIKNFEAMACGCVLIAYNHGDIETKAVGFVDMHNVVLFTKVDELIRKLNILRQDEELRKIIVDNAKELVRDRFDFYRLGKEIVDAMQPPLRKPKKTGLITRFFNKAGY